MTLRVLTRPKELVEIDEAWRELASTTPTRPFTHPFWCLPWYRNLGKGRPFVVVLEEGGKLVALAPFFERRLAGIGLVRFLGHGLGAVSAPVIAPGYQDAAAGLWEAALSGRRFAELLEYDSTGPGLAALQALDGRRRAVSSRDVCPVIQLEGSLESWWEASNKELRRVLRRAERAVDASGGAHEVELVRQPDRLEAVLADLVAVHDAAEAANPRQHLLRGRWAPFTRELLRAAADAGHLRLFICRVDGRAVSFTVMLTGAGTMGMWLNRFDPEFARFSPGHLTLRAAVEQGFAEGLHEVDLLIGTPRYKWLWTRASYETMTVHAASSPTVFRTGRALLAAADLRRRRRHHHRSQDRSKP